MSPTLLAQLNNVERVAQRWARSSYRTCIDAGMSPSKARYYSSRRECWGDACTMLRYYRGVGELS